MYQQNQPTFAVPPGSVAAAEYVDITANADLFALVNAQGFSSARHAAAALSSGNALHAAVSSHASITASATGAELEAQSVCCSRPVLQAILLPVVVYVPGQGHVVIGFVQVWICQNLDVALAAMLANKQRMDRPATCTKAMEMKTRPDRVWWRAFLVRNSQNANLIQNAQ